MKRKIINPITHLEEDPIRLKLDGNKVEVGSSSIDWEYYLGKLGAPLNWVSRFFSEGLWFLKKKGRENDP